MVVASNNFLTLLSLSSLALCAQSLAPVTLHNSPSKVASTSTSSLFMSDWGSFSALDDDEDLDFSVDTREYAKEEDSQELKAQVGASLEAPSILNDAEPISVPAGSQLGLDEETVLGVLSACREEIGTVFGYSAENRGVGITGGA